MLQREGSLPGDQQAQGFQSAWAGSRALQIFNGGGGEAFGELQGLDDIGDLLVGVLGEGSRT